MLTMQERKSFRDKKMQNIHLNNIAHIDKRKLKNVYATSRNSAQNSSLDDGQQRDDLMREMEKMHQFLISPQIDKKSELIKTVEADHRMLQNP